MKKLLLGLLAATALSSAAQATITNQAVSVTDQADGVTSLYNFSFLVPYQSDGVTPAVTVTTIDPSGNIVVLTPASYTVAGVGNAAGGSILISGSPLVAGTSVIITRSLNYVQPYVFQNQSFLPHSVENTADNLEAQVQQLRYQNTFDIQFPPTEQNPQGTLPAVAARASSILGFGSNGLMTEYPISMFTGSPGNLTNQIVSTNVSGATCTGSSDDGAALNTSIAALSTAGGGILWINGSCGWPGRNLTMAKNVQVRGLGQPVGLLLGGQATGAEIRIDPAFTIVPTDRSAILGVRITRNGFSWPTNLQTSLDDWLAFAGTAITNSAGARDFTVADSVFEGFQTAVNSTAVSDRFTFTHNLMDTNNGLLVAACTDTCHFTENEKWPASAFSFGFSSASVTGVINNGGVVELVLGSMSPALTLKNNYPVVVYGITGTVEANNRWLITVLDQTHVLLQGSVFSNAYVSGGTFFIDSLRRTGIGISLTGSGIGGEMMANYTDFSTDTSLFIGAGHGPVTVNGCWLDGDTVNANFTDPGQLRLEYDGFGLNLNGCFFSSGGHMINVNTATTTRALQITNSVIGLTGQKAGVTGSGLNVISGAVAVDNSTFAADGHTLPWLFVGDGSTYVHIANSIVDAGAFTIRSGISYQTAPATNPADCNKVIIDGMSSCPFTPILAGSVVPGTPTFAANSQSGRCRKKALIEYTCDFFMNVTSLGGLSGNLEVLVPAAFTDGASITASSCAVSRASGLIYDTNFNQLSAQISQGTAFISLTELSSTTQGPQNLTDQNVMATGFTIAVSCTYPLPE